MATTQRPSVWAAQPPALVRAAMSGQRWRRRGLVALLAGLYILAWGVVSLIPLDPTDLDVFFLPSARIALAGHPLHVYALRFAGDYPNANGPLSLVPLAAVAALAQRLGWLDNPSLVRALVMAVFSVFSLLMAWEGVAAIDRLRGVPLAGWRRLFAYGVFAFAPTLAHGMIFYGHIELPLMLWLLLFGARALSEGHPGRAGVALGLAILTRSSALTYLLALLIVLLARRRWHALGWLGGGAGASIALGLLPFYLGDRADLIYSLVTFHGELLVWGGSIMQAFVNTPYGALAQHDDTLFVLGGAVAVSVALALARRDLRPGVRDVYALLALAGLCFPLFLKTVWPYYFLDAYILLAVWWLGSPHALDTLRGWLGALLPAYFVGCAFLTEFGTGLTTYPLARLPESLAEAALVGGFIAVFGGYLVRARPRVSGVEPSAAPLDAGTLGAVEVRSALASHAGGD